MSTKKLIGMVVPNLGSGGGEKSTLTLALEMQKQGHETYIFMLNNSIEYPDATLANVICLYDQKKIRNRFKRIKVLTQELGKAVNSIEKSSNKKFDLLIANMNKSFEVCLKLDHPSTVYCVRNSLSHYLNTERKKGLLKYWICKSLFKKLSNKHVVAISEGVRKEFERFEYITPESLRTIYNPFSIEKIRLSAAASKPSISEPYIIHVGRPVKVKRHDLLFKALLDVPQKYKLVLLGRDVNKLKKMALEHGILERIHFIGFDANPYSWMKHAALTVLCSDNEGLGRVIIESLACGTGVVSTDCEWGPNEILTGSLSQYLCPTNDVKALSRTINKALAADIDLSAPEILQKINTDHIIKQYCQLADDIKSTAE